MSKSPGGSLLPATLSKSAVMHLFLAAASSPAEASLALDGDPSRGPAGVLTSSVLLEAVKGLSAHIS